MPRRSIARRRPQVIWASALVLATSVAMAHAQVAFDHELTLLGGPESGASGVMQATADQPGVVDIATRKGGALVYYRIERGEAGEPVIAVDAERVAGLTHFIAGIRRVDGTVRIGTNTHKRLMAWTRGADGTWTGVDSGARAAGYAGRIIGYDADPTTGRSGFVTVDDQHRSIAVLEGEDGDWQTQVLAFNQLPMVRSAFAFAADGTPLVAYQMLDNPAALRAGALRREADVPGGAYRYFPVAIRADDAGGMHVAVPLTTGRVQYAYCPGPGKAWSTPTLVAGGANYGDPVGCDLAVSRDGRSIAMLFIDRAGALALATSHDRGETFTARTIEGARAQQPAVAIDPAGDLYVVAFHAPVDADASALRLYVKRGFAAR